MHKGLASTTPVALAPRIRGAVGELVSSWPSRIVAIVVVAALVAGAVIVRQVATTEASPSLPTAQVTRASITQTVAMSGSVNAAAQVRLNFKSSGKIAEILVSVGQQVSAGDPLARLDPTDLATFLSQAQANLAAAQARYDQAVAGATPEDIAIARQTVDNAQRSVDEAQRTSQNDLAAAQQALGTLEAGYGAAKTNFTRLATDIPNAVGTLGTSASSANTQAATSVSDIQRVARQTSDVVIARNAVLQAQGSIQTAQSYLTGSVQDALNEYLAARDALNDVIARFDFALRNGRDTAGVSQEYLVVQAQYVGTAARLASSFAAPGGQLQSAQASVAAAQSSLNNAATRIDPDLDPARADLVALQNTLTAGQQLVSGLALKLTEASTAVAVITDAIAGGYRSAQQSVQTTQERANASVINAQNALASAQASLARTAGAPKSYDVAAAYATVLSSQAAVQKAQSDLDNATLRSPTAAVIAQVNNQVGEAVSGATPFMLLANISSYALHGTVGEADVAKLRLGQAATITIDALGAGPRLSGKVTAIDPLATIQQGVPLYGVDVTLDSPSAQVRSGMSGTASIAATKPDVLAVPGVAVHREAGRSYVQVVRDGRPVNAEVTTGISNGSQTEVTAGLQEGETVLLPQPRSTSSQPVFGLGGDQPVILRASAPFAYSVVTGPSLERVAIVVTIANRSADDLQINPADFAARDAERQVYPADLAATVADARAVSQAAAPLAMRGIVPLTVITLRKDDVLSGFVVFDVPAGVRPVQLIFRQSDTDRVVDLSAAP
jgi:RND family efflux transporter MFP subunit